MANQIKFKFKRKIKIKYNRKLQPMLMLTTPYYSKSSSSKALIKRFIKKFKAPSRAKKASYRRGIKKASYRRGVKKASYRRGVKKISYLRGVKKVSYRRGVKKISYPRGVKRYVWNRWSFKKRNKFRKFVSSRLKHAKQQSRPSVTNPSVSRFLTSLMLPDILRFRVFALKHVEYTSACSKTVPNLKTALLFKTVPNLKIATLFKKQRQYIKKIIVSKYSWYKDKRFVKLKVARKRLKRLTNRFRKIKRNFAFNVLIKRQFYALTGLSYVDFQTEWKKNRRGKGNYFGGFNLASALSTNLIMSAPNLLYLLGFAPSISAGKALIKSGILVCNSKMVTGLIFFKAGDVFQFVQGGLALTKLVYGAHHWRFNSSLLVNFPFLNIDAALALVMVLRQPYTF